MVSRDQILYSHRALSIIGSNLLCLARKGSGHARLVFSDGRVGGRIGIMEIAGKSFEAGAANRIVM